MILSFGVGGALKLPEFPLLSRLLEDLTETFRDFLSGDRLRPRFRSCRLSTRLDILQQNILESSLIEAIKIIYK